MKLTEFIERFKEGIGRRVVESYPPRYRPSADPRPIPPLLRKPLGGQADAIRGAALSLGVNRGTTIVGEMGVGKTLIGAAAAEMAGFRRSLILCPPHLTRKWKREVEETLPSAQAVIVSSITDLEKLPSAQRTGSLFVILSRERAKLGFRWKPAYVKRWARSGGRLFRYQVPEGEPRFNEQGGPVRGLGITWVCCPECFTQVTDSEGLPLNPQALARKRHQCPNCGGALWTADHEGRHRFPLADYIKLRMRGFFQLLIADEVHEFKGRGSAQGIAAGVLADVCGRSLTLTGTLMGGYSSTLFHLLYRFSPELRAEFAHNEVQRWVTRYGFLERRKAKGNDDEDDYGDDGRQTRRRNYRNTVKELPGLAPAALFHLIPHTVFLRLADVAANLPPYEEQVQLSDLDGTIDASGYSQGSAYRHLFDVLLQVLLAQLKEGKIKLLSTYLQTLLAYPDGCPVRGELVMDPETQLPLVEAPALDPERVYPKEQALLDLVQSEKRAGRKVLVYVTHTGIRDITGRLNQVLSRTGVRVVVLKSDTVSPQDRESWVNDRVKQGVDALVCHPGLVQTGLDLVDFPTIIWFETHYSVYVMRQASRRSWRIGQTRPVRVVYMAYRETLQAKALALVAKKLQSSLAVEGELPEEGLAVHGDEGGDLMMELARQIAQGADDGETVEDIFARARSAEAEAEELLVDEDWALPEPLDQGGEEHASPRPVTAFPPPEDEEVRQLDIFSLAEFIKQDSGQDEGKSRRRKPKPQPSSESLFEWAINEATNGSSGNGDHVPS